jgi:hypothetical protein
MTRMPPTCAKLSAMTFTVLLILGVSSPAHANSIIPTFVSSVSNGSGGFTYTYTVQLTAAEQMDPNVGTDLFAIYDFYGFIPGSQTKSGGDLIAGHHASDYFVFSAPLFGTIGIPPGPTFVPDNPTVPNMQWSYTDGTPTGTALPPVAAGALNLGTYTFDSTMGLHGSASYAGQANDASSDAVTQNFGSIVVPATVPEPGSIFLLGTGLLCAASAIRRRQRKPQ